MDATQSVSGLCRHRFRLGSCFSSSCSSSCSSSDTSLGSMESLIAAVMELTVSKSWALIVFRIVSAASSSLSPSTWSPSTPQTFPGSAAPAPWTMAAFAASNCCATRAASSATPCPPTTPPVSPILITPGTSAPTRNTNISIVLTPVPFAPPPTGAMLLLTNASMGATKFCMGLPGLEASTAVTNTFRSARTAASSLLNVSASCSATSRAFSCSARPSSRYCV
mmetsp:Transcript_56177/g.137989  ORF Transcript_56177/g.137989 Transcript_56177/m.137989 type:complete len:223 (+) Transcript_56177:142-810(+)